MSGVHHTHTHLHRNRRAVVAEARRLFFFFFFLAALFTRAHQSVPAEHVDQTWIRVKEQPTRLDPVARRNEKCCARGRAKSRRPPAPPRQRFDRIKYNTDARKTDVSTRD